MPKTKEKSSIFLARVVSEFPDDFQSDGSILFCKRCDIEVAAKQISQVKQHMETGKHLSSLKRKTGNVGEKTQSMLTTLNEKFRDTNEFNVDLTECFVKSNIPLYKLREPAMIDFLEKHTKYAAPSESSLRSKYMPKIYEEYIDKMKRIAAGQNIWVSLDETTDSEQRYVVNFVFGILGVDEERERCYLFSSKVLEKVNHTTIAKFFDETIMELGKCSNRNIYSVRFLLLILISVRFLGVDKERVLLCLTDGAPYMSCAMNSLNILYTKMIHFTCAAHALHRVAEFVRDTFSNVNKLISSVKKIFTKVNI